MAKQSWWTNLKGQMEGQLVAPKREVIYGVTDRSGDGLSQKIDDWLIDHSGVSTKEKGQFFHSLQMLVKSGISFTRAVEILGQRSKNKRLSRILATIVYDMQVGGRAFSTAMGKYPSVFTDSEQKMIYSGEIAGKMEETLESISNQISKNIKLESSVKSAMMYPMTVIVAIILAAAVVLIFVVPQFTSLFEQFDTDLPATTQALVDASDFLKRRWWLVLTLLVGGWMLFTNWRRGPGRETWAGWLLQMPLISPIVNNIQTVRIANNFSALMKSGIPVNKALHILAEIMPNAMVANAIFRIEQRVLMGQSIAQSFKSETDYIDDIIPEVIEIGEKTGRIPEVLSRTGAQYEQAVDEQLKNITTIIEPLIIILMGASVVFMAMAIMTPIFKIQEAFAG